MAPTAPYPVSSEIDEFTQMGSSLAKEQSLQQHFHEQEHQQEHQQHQQQPPLDDTTLMNKNAHFAATVTSPRFNLGPVPSSDSIHTGDIPDIAHQLSRQKILLHPYPEPDHLLSSEESHAAQGANQSNEGHGLSFGLGLGPGPGPGPRGSSPLQIPLYNGHSRSISLTLSMFLDRLDNGGSIDFNQNLLQQHLGPNSSHLLPRMKTIELYRKNARKLSDPAVLFQYAQYMLQTALLLDPSPSSSAFGDSVKALPGTAPPTPPNKSLDSRQHIRSASSLSLDHASSSQDPDLRASLLKEAHHFLKRLSDKGYVDAQYFLGDAYSSGAFGKVDNKEAFNLFLAAAKRGHIECAFRTAHCYEEGLGVGRDARKGVDFLKTAAAKNHPAAMYKLGMYSFYSRMGISDNAVNKKLGIKWLERALLVATELTSAAPYELGKLYQTGYSDILIKDEKYALELFAQAAAFGHVEAAAILGHHYEVGNIVAADPNLSIHYYTKAALGGHAQSMLAMCAWYMVGSEPYLPKDELEAFEWAKRAASCGHSKAQYVLANFLDKGIGCEQNAVEAQSWYIKAAQNGMEKALARVKDSQKAADIAKKMKKTKKSAPSTSGTHMDAQEKDCVIM